MLTTFKLKSQELEGYSPLSLDPFNDFITTHLIPQENWITAQAVRYFEIDIDVLFPIYNAYLTQFGKLLDKLTEGNQSICATDYEELLPDYIHQLLDLAFQLGCSGSCKQTINQYLQSHEDTQDLASDAGIEL